MRLLAALATCLFFLGCQADVSNEVAKVKDYAERYEPQIRKEKAEEFGEITTPPPGSFADVPDAQTLAAIDKLASVGSRAHEKHVVLVFLRHYRAQMEVAHQSYELRELRARGFDNPLVKELCRLIECPPPDAESVYSDVVYAWVKKHPELQQYEPIRAEVKRIEAVNRQIEEGLKETRNRKSESDS